MIAVQGHFGKHPPLLCFGQSRIVDHERNAQRLLVVSPLAGEAAVAEVVAVVGGVDDDGVVGEALFFQLLHESADHVINSAEHAEVGAHVGLVFLRGIPAPEEALPVDGFLEEVGLGFVNRRIVERREGHLLVLVHPVGDFRPGEVTDAGALVSVFGVGGIEAELQAEGLILRVVP